ncbi:hypothetical protein T4B_1800 [Trichinella pseudospiralis]|uniref:Uncharacterized protein n=1 Tax=Trichinella pseudospiralis TaxID=6337 RepID=A0A0V1J8G9_TRIPS|nr:hypothetical protein T4A_12372 [Trichinella pseudospiralis]KRZ22970.1 hypothetical protein T4B_1800 [Trichinella pseudospiralis]KRZ31287.1 hypothetical protein T4C_13493 [Trichinella pseudospiralis]
MYILTGINANHSLMAPSNGALMMIYATDCIFLFHCRGGVQFSLDIFNIVLFEKNAITTNNMEQETFLILIELQT